MTITAYDEQNPFAKIIRGELPAHKIYEDDETLAFMDIMPRGTGHCLVIPKRPSRSLLDADAESLSALMQTVQKLARAVIPAFGADGVMVGQFNGQAAGQTVFHLHFHVIPRFEGIALTPEGGPMENPDVLAENAQKIRAALDADGNRPS